MEKTKDDKTEIPRERACVDLDRLTAETGMTIAEMASFIGLKGTGPIYKWKSPQKGYGRPDYDTIVYLMEKGASPEALFGRPFKNSPANVSMSDEEFQAGVREVVNQMKKEGLL